MAYRNRFGPLGHRWIEPNGIQLIVSHFPENRYSITVSFTDGTPDMPLSKCTGYERNLDTLTIRFKDANGRRDPDPFVWEITGKLDATFFIYSTPPDINPVTFFFNRCKTSMYPQTENEDPGTVLSLRKEARAKFANYVHMSGIDDRAGSGDSLTIPVNCFTGEGRTNLLRFLANVDKDGIQVFVDVRFDRATVDQLQRLDTDMEFGDLGEVLDIADSAEQSQH